MGRIATFLTGVVVLGASQAVTLLGEYASTIEGAPVDYELIVEWASFGLLVLGVAITGYALLSILFSVIRHNYRKRKEIQQREEAERRRQQPPEGYGPQGQPVGGQNQQRPQQPRDQYRRREQ